MGCASSSPLVSENGGIVGAAKHAATDLVHAGEGALHDVGDSINDTVGHVKDVVVGTVHGIGHGIDNAIHGGNHPVDGGNSESSDDKKKIVDEKIIATTAQNVKSAVTTTTTTNETEYTYIPLKSPNPNVSEHLEEFKETLLKKAQSFSDDTDKMADELIKETDDIIDNGTELIKKEIKNVKDDIKHMDFKPTPVHSIDGGSPKIMNTKMEKTLDSIKISPTSSLKPIKNNDIIIDTINQLNDEKLSKMDDLDRQNLQETIGYFNNHSNSENSMKNHSNLINESSSLELTPQNDVQIIDNECNIDDLFINEPTHWEILADTIVKLPIIKYDNYKSSNSASTDNLHEENIDNEIE